MHVQEACEDLGIDLPHYGDGQHQNLLCPFCNGGDKQERSFSVRVETVAGKGMKALYHCFRSNNCGEKGMIPDKARHSHPVPLSLQAGMHT